MEEKKRYTKERFWRYGFKKIVKISEEEWQARMNKRFEEIHGFKRKIDIKDDNSFIQSLQEKAIKEEQSRT